ncbi:transcriptional regulator SlyA [Vibrio gangliei]|uniref:transcriptional regulator SlyA n=1 Tax=Vibrio gangliei TaxID=2077090 RepID=UPI000D021B55|nr:transcriptional regulator SlyA [Vibrio gangliei]
MDSLEQQHLQHLPLAERLGRLTRLWRMVADAELSPLGLTHPRWSALWKLRQLGDCISQKCLAEGLEIELASLMRTLNQLEEQNLITRQPCPNDKRARLVCLTPQGEKILRQMEKRIFNVRKKVLSGLSEQQLQEFEFVVEKITRNACEQLKR